MFKLSNNPLLIAITYFAFTLLLTMTWFNHNYFDVYDIFFDTDPSSNLASFAHGWGRHAITHAFIETIAIPIRIASAIAFNLNLISDQTQFRELVSLLISPLASTLSLVVFFKILENLNFSKKETFLFTFIYSLSFTNIIFASIPETYAISNLLISTLLLFYVQEMNSKTKIKDIYWILVGILLTGTTITNGCIFFLVYFSSQFFHNNLSLAKSVIKSISISILVLSTVVVFYETSHRLLEIPKGSEGGIEWIQMYTTQDPFQALSNLMNFGAASVSSFFPFGFSYEVNSSCLENQMYCNTISLQHGIPSLILTIKFLIFIIFILTSYKKENLTDHMKKVTYLCRLIILFNLVLHTLFGRETFMYTQHWITPLTLLLLPLLAQKQWRINSFILMQIILTLSFFVNLEGMISLS